MMPEKRALNKGFLVYFRVKKGKNTCFLTPAWFGSTINDTKQAIYTNIGAK